MKLYQVQGNGSELLHIHKEPKVESTMFMFLLLVTNNHVHNEKTAFSSYPIQTLVNGSQPGGRAAPKTRRKNLFFYFFHIDSCRPRKTAKINFGNIKK